MGRGASCFGTDSLFIGEMHWVGGDNGGHVQCGGAYVEGKPVKQWHLFSVTFFFLS